jgi:hypothetical protein
MSPPNIDALSGDELRSLVLKLLEEVAELRGTVAAQRDEIARLKGGPGRPNLKPSGMDKTTEPKPPASGGGHRGRGPTRSKLSLHEERTLKIEAPSGSRFKGYAGFLVQDLVIRARVTHFRRECWLTPGGERVMAALPEGIDGHFGPELRRFVLAQYHQGQVTVPRLLALLQGFGILISKRQIVRLLTAGKEAFLDEARDVLRAGLKGAAWITVDDTGARHKATNGYCTQIGNDRFTWFGTTGSKSRMNFLDLLRAGHSDYVLNSSAFAYMRQRNLSDGIIARLAADSQLHFADQATWSNHLERLGIAELKVHPDPVTIATEGALWGSVGAHGHLIDAVVLSDDAGQFAVGRHALCWVHAERLVHKLEAFSDRDRAAQNKLRGLIWNYYRDLKLYQSDPSPRRRAQLRQRFDRIFKRRTGWTTLDRLLKRLNANKPELLVALDRPEIPLHTNGSENDIRCQVTKRKISGGTRSDAGRDCRDAFLGLAKTCAKLNISFWDYLGARLTVPSTPLIPSLAQIVSAYTAQPP